MPEKKTKVRSDKKLVEVPPELLEVVDLAANSETSQLPVSETPHPVLQTSQSPVLHTASESQLIDTQNANSQIVLPSLKIYLIKGSLFTLISLVLFGLPYFIAPSALFPGLEYPHVRTTLLMLLIWNLMGAALFAQARTRLAKTLAIVLFGCPLALGVWLLAFVVFLGTYAQGKYPGF